YLVPWQSIPSAIDLALVVAAGALVVAGFVAAAPAARARSTRAVLTMFGAPLAVATLLITLFARRLAVSASYAQYRGAFGVEPIGSSALGKGVLLAILTLALGIAWTHRELR